MFEEQDDSEETEDETAGPGLNKAQRDECLESEAIIIK